MEISLSTRQAVYDCVYVALAEDQDCEMLTADDQLGASNLITPAKVQNAAKLVKTGQMVSLAHAVPQKVEADVFRFFQEIAEASDEERAAPAFREIIAEIGDAGPANSRSVLRHLKGPVSHDVPSAARRGVLTHGEQRVGDLGLSVDRGRRQAEHEQGENYFSHE